MGLWLGTLDTRTLEMANLLDGPDDKKIDFFDLASDTGVVTIAQSFESPDWSKQSPPASKASDLNTAIAWLLDSDLDQIPRPSIRAAAEELRDALIGGAIRRVDILFVHNLGRSHEVDAELATVGRHLLGSLERYTTEEHPIEGRALQLDAASVDSHRRALHDAIAVQDEVFVESSSPLVAIAGGEWKAVSGTVEGTQLVEWHRKFGDDLFNANVRDFLGNRDTARNINNQIRTTALTEAENFWIFNNGITLLTNEIATDGTRLRLSGVSVINGAQTTGSLRTAADEGSVAGARVPFRAIECRDPGLVLRIIRYNNLQNPVTAWDRRSIDPLQLTLQEKLSAFGITYQLRRGEARRKATDVHLDKLGPYLISFYGEPIAAANKSEVFEVEARYRRAFRDATDPRHILFVYLLGEAVANAKVRLRGDVDGGGPAGTRAEETYRYFRYGAFANIVIAAAGRILGVWLAGKDAGYLFKVALAADPQSHLDEWLAVLGKLIDNAVLPAVRSALANTEDDDLFPKMKTQAGALEIAQGAEAVVEQVHGMTPETYQQITSELILT